MYNNIVPKNNEEPEKFGSSNLSQVKNCAKILGPKKVRFLSVGQKPLAPMG